MKYFVLLGDGMADLPIDQWSGMTPMEKARKPLIDAMAQAGEMGMCKITPPGCNGGSDVGNLAVMGYDPRVYLTGRAPLEAAAMGVSMREDDLALRCNLACVSEEEDYEKKTMLDYSSDEVSSEEARVLIEALNSELASDQYEWYPGISYRHLMLVHGGSTKLELTPPHNITGKPVEEYLPKGEGAELLLELMKRSYEILSKHPVNLARVAAGKHPANTCWFWGQGSKPGLAPFAEKYGKTGAVVTAVDLVRGIGRLADMKAYDVPGATGTLETNWRGKAQAVLQAFDDGFDFCYLHFEAPDECGHRNEADRKVQAIEMLDEALRMVTEGLESRGEQYGVLIMPDHPTPLATGAHSSAPVPYVLYYSDQPRAEATGSFCERTAQQTGIMQDPGYELLGRLFARTSVQKAEPIKEPAEAKAAAAMAEKEALQAAKVADDKRFPRIWQGMLAAVLMPFFQAFASAAYRILLQVAPTTGYTKGLLGYVFAQMLVVLPLPFLMLAVFRKDITASARMKKRINLAQIFMLVTASIGAFSFFQYLNGRFLAFLSSMGIVFSTKVVGDTAPANLFQYILSCVVIAGLPAFCEEFFFRGLVMRSMERRGRAYAILLSSVAFGVMHGNLTQIAYAFFIGLIAATVTMYSDSLWAGSTIHFTLNLLSILFNSGKGKEIYSTLMQNNISALAIIFVISPALLAAGLGGFLLYTKGRNIRRYGAAMPRENRFELQKPLGKEALPYAACWIVFTLINVLEMMSVAGGSVAK